jgi:hypothetical protein
MMLTKLLLSSIGLIGLTGLASAADMYVKAAPIYVPTWTRLLSWRSCRLWQRGIHRSIHFSTNVQHKR